MNFDVTLFEMVLNVINSRLIGILKSQVIQSQFLKKVNQLYTLFDEKLSKKTAPKDYKQKGRYDLLTFNKRFLPDFINATTSCKTEELEPRQSWLGWKLNPTIG
jgi:hypothetical protein